jgi:hypothetical protein
MADNQPGFGSLMLSGVQGYFKGAIIGASIGAAGGALIGLAIGLLVPPILITSVVSGATLGGLSFGTIGSLAGGMTGIITKSREGQMSGEEAAKAVKIAYAQGLERGQSRAEEPLQETTRWRDKYAKEKSERAVDGSQKLH